ncbi:MAG TPA: hypothetical protein VKU94_04495 [Geobacterales bacterium]|nr:hypothetical protein [Geobacterales bacterium]
MVNPAYFQGVAIGLLIAWVTGLIAYLRVSNDLNSLKSAFLYLIILEALLFVAFSVISLLLRS